ncbi:stage III sporulation protein AF [Calorimonas adulescens]|jgi:stage III sporulation protein AF|uniref:Stage III sporulation protein AF n=1 Tax=Calorimonas adulescens TaxID=2606906 RepID=A0A5D8QG23_9THEO|nr:stage III sporulation protein AF [Calorimonas adulescens]TZE83451.1 stage III sporulation protein AF [Calorimonas adulescens]
MNFLKSWIINIFVVMIFITILDAIMPGSNFKKYIDMVTGLIIIITILSPVINFIKGEDFIQKEVLSNTIGLKSEEFSNDNKYLKVYEEVFKSQYKKNMEDNIQQWLSKKYDADIKKVSIDYNSDIGDTEHFGYIKRVEIQLDDVSEDLKAKIIEDISSFYNVDKANITISG